MSLMRQVWMLVLGVVVLSLIGGVAVSANSMRQLVQTQLQVKNSDNAAALALAMSQQHGDESLMTLLMSAQFDTGYYESMQWHRADGSLAFERHEEAGHPSEAPAWFVALLPIQAQAGAAQVSNGWNALGSVEVRSHTAYAHDALWHDTLHNGMLQFGVGLLAGLMAVLVLKRVRKPIDAAVEQANAVVQGRFVTVSEAKVPELKPLTQAMNTMVLRMKGLFEAQAGQLQVLQQQTLCDSLTGLSQRKHFLAELESALTRDVGPAHAGLILVRLRDLATLNSTLGHAQVDQLLLTLGRAVKAYPDRVMGCLGGRLNGSDFALWLPAPDVVAETAQALVDVLGSSLVASFSGVNVAVAGVELPRHSAVSNWFGEADAALARAEQGQGISLYCAVSAASERPAQGERVWRAQINEALQQNRLRLQQFPLVDQQGLLVHLECPLQMQLTEGGEFVNGVNWLPLAQRSRLTGEVDLQAVGLALARIGEDGKRRCVNIAPSSLTEGAFIARLRDLVFRSPQSARKLGLELPEVAAMQHFDVLHELSRQLRPLGVLVGLEHADAGLAQVERLFQAELDYVKLDSSVVSGVADDNARLAFLRGMVIMLRSLSLQIYAEGVSDARDVPVLWECGVHGVTGPWATAQHQGA
ncbi:MAG: EAL domain-containing protein [Burkholderiaceae bacterium]|nr:EAL domain-containing protein [Burkholderiaceae bacterium]